MEPRLLARILLLVLAMVVAIIDHLFSQDQADRISDRSTPRRPGPIRRRPSPWSSTRPWTSDDMVLQWGGGLRRRSRALPPGPTMMTRAISVVHTASYDASTTL